MKLLIITQKVDINDDNLGSFHDWLKKLAGFADINVIANYAGGYELPENAKIFSLGKENGAGKIVKFLRYQWFLLKLLPKVDGVFFHMCPEYVIAAGFWPKIFRRKTLLWYTHKSVNWKLKLAEKLVDKIFTASKESFRLPSKKVEITGHGIDINKFKSHPASSGTNLKKKNKFTIISVGRISPVKNYDILIDVAEILKTKTSGWEIKIAGAPILEKDKVYLEKLKNLIQKKNLGGIIEFVGPIPNKNIVEFYQSGDLFVNLSDTGSLDRAVLEAMACGLKILTSNEAFKNIVPEENFTAKSAEEIAQKIIYLAKNVKNNHLRDCVAQNHDLKELINKIISFYG